MTKRFFQLGTSKFSMEYRASLAWDVLRSQLPSLKMSEVMASIDGGQIKKTIASDLVDASFAIADCFIDKVEYREDLIDTTEKQ